MCRALLSDSQTSFAIPLRMLEASLANIIVEDISDVSSYQQASYIWRKLMKNGEFYLSGLVCPLSSAEHKSSEHCRSNVCHAGCSTLNVHT